MEVTTMTTTTTGTLYMGTRPSEQRIRKELSKIIYGEEGCCDQRRILYLKVNENRDEIEFKYEVDDEDD